MAGVVGAPEGEGTSLSPRTVDNAASGPPRSRAWTRGGTCVPRQPRPGHSVQDPRPGRGETAQSANYLEQRDPDFAEKMAEVLCVYRQVTNPEAGRSRLEEEAERRDGDHFLRREARHTGHRNDRPRLAARARRACDLRT